MIDFNIITAKSIKHSFEFINHSSSSQIELIFNDEINNEKKEIWFDYQQFLELEDFINTLKEKH